MWGVPVLEGEGVANVYLVTCNTVLIKNKCEREIIIKKYIIIVLIVTLQVYRTL